MYNTQTVIDEDYLQRAVELITWLTFNHCINLWLTYQYELLNWPCNSIEIIELLHTHCRIPHKNGLQFCLYPSMKSNDMPLSPYFESFALFLSVILNGQVV